MRSANVWDMTVLGGRSRLAERRNAVYIGILRWEVGRWDRRQDDAIPANAEHEDGCVAYAKHQADLHRNLALSFEARWAETLALVDVD
jgi:hypothetical protein